MAQKKESFISYCWEPICVALLVLLCNVVLIMLQRLCMSSRTNDFVDSYCLRDKNMRAVVSACLTVIIFALARLVSRTIRSFRTWRLVHGINEGVFIAVGSGVTYRLRSIAKGGTWALVVILIIFIEYVPEFSQTFANVATTTESVYVKSNSTAEFYSDAIDYGGGLETARKVASVVPPGPGSFLVLPTSQGYGSASVSTLNQNQVQTFVTREILVTNIKAYNESNYSIKHTDVIAKVVTSCSSDRRENTTFTDTEDRFSKLENNGTTLASNANSTYKIEEDSAVFKTEKTFVYCIGTGVNNCNISTTFCQSRLELSRSEFIYTVGTKKTTFIRIVDKNTTIKISDFAELVNGLITAPEYMALLSAGQLFGQPNSDFSDVLNGLLCGTKCILTNLYVVESALLSTSVFNTGLFNSSGENELHARVCASASVLLLQLFSLSLGTKGNTTDLDPNYALSSERTTYPSLYVPITQAYMSTQFVVAITMFFIVATLILVYLDIYCFHMSPINIKETNELALIDNIGDNIVSVRSKHHLSNDVEKQKIVAFENTLFCKEKGTYPDVSVAIEYNNTGNVPNKNTKYK